MFFGTAFSLNRDRARDLHPNMFIGHRKAHTSLKCVNRSRLAFVERQYNKTKTMSSAIAFTLFIETNKSLFARPLPSDNHKPYTLHPSMFIKHRKPHTSLKCVLRSRLAFVEREYNFNARQCHRTSNLHTSLKCTNRSRSAPVKRNRINLTP